MIPDAFDVSGRVVLVTGAGRGIGKGVARVLAEAGAEVAINALTDRHVVPLANELSEATGRRVLPVVADVTKPEGARDAVEQALAAFGRIDVLVNGLGDSIRTPLVGLPGDENDGIPISDDDLAFIIDINLSEALLCTRAVGPHMLARGSGKVINISSWTGHQGGGEMVLYTTAKTALAGFTRAQALEWAPHGVQVNCIAPGLFPDVVTVGEERLRQTGERAKQVVPLGRPGELEEVGYLALYLASSASDYMTGQTIVLDGGLSL
ncbi:MAG: SDR family NAD(P)-dependent oxidoreductase [Alphaproteobacteria bacterium]|jgi:NAD(P)-dependent dehydrogenase (short-subunit alcohol dehydrogenase family)|nr:SDR family NAD(P)-dependent oxidoreductase [Alphaproteobacteria bacterium]